MILNLKKKSSYWKLISKRKKQTNILIINVLKLLSS